MSIKSDLAQFYSQNAKHYYQTRQKYRADGQHFLKAIKGLGIEKPKILELGCGGGRLLSFLKAEYQGDFEYCGVDIAQGLLDLAQKDHPEARFICADMVGVFQQLEQESFDVVVACASFQHLPSEEERLKLLQQAYRVLKYEGICLMTNWAFSHWFLKKHWRVFLKSFTLWGLSLGRISWRDVFIPWKAQNQVHKRYYHLFGLSELKTLFLLSGFVLDSLEYRDRKGDVVEDWKLANNSFCLGKKTVFMSKS